MNYPEGTIEHPIDNQGRKHITTTGLDFTIIKRKPFREWLSKYYNAGEFDKLVPEEKRTIFLRWKWGLENKITTFQGKTKYNDEGNYSAEFSRKDDLRNFDAMIKSVRNEGTRWYWENIKADENYCNEVARDIGLIVEKSILADKVKEMFNSEVKFGLGEER